MARTLAIYAGRDDDISMWGRRRTASVHLDAALIYFAPTAFHAAQSWQRLLAVMPSLE